jgi:hypothetical protein
LGKIENILVLDLDPDKKIKIITVNKKNYVSKFASFVTDIKNYNYNAEQNFENRKALYLSTAEKTKALQEPPKPFDPLPEKKFDVYLSFGHRDINAHSDFIQLEQNLQNIVDGISKNLPWMSSGLLKTEKMHTTIFGLYFRKEMAFYNQGTAIDRKKDYQKVMDIARKYLPLKIKYQGLLLTTDGTIIAKGHCEGKKLDEMRHELVSELDVEGRKAVSIIHITIGRLKQQITLEEWLATQKWIDEFNKKNGGYIGEIVAKNPVLVAGTDNEGIIYHEQARQEIEEFSRTEGKKVEFKNIFETTESIIKAINDDSISEFIPDWKNIKKQLISKKQEIGYLNILDHVKETIINVDKITKELAQKGIKIDAKKLRMIMFFHDFGKSISEMAEPNKKDGRLHELNSEKMVSEILDSLNFSEIEKKEILFYVKNHGLLGSIHIWDVRFGANKEEFINSVTSAEQINTLMAVSLCDLTNRPWIGDEWNLTVIKTLGQLIGNICAHKDEQDSKIKLDIIVNNLTKMKALFFEKIKPICISQGISAPEILIIQRNLYAEMFEVLDKDVAIDLQEGDIRRLESKALLSFQIQKLPLHIDKPDTHADGEIRTIDTDNFDTELVLTGTKERTSIDRDFIERPVVKDGKIDIEDMGKNIDEFRKEYPGDYELILSAHSESGFWGANSALLINGELLTKPEGSRGIFQDVYQKMNGKFYVLSLDPRYKGVYEVNFIEGKIEKTLIDGQEVKGCPIKNGIFSPAILINGDSKLDEIEYGFAGREKYSGKLLSVPWEKEDLASMACMGYDKEGNLIHFYLAGDPNDKIKHEFTIEYFMGQCNDLGISDAIIVGRSADIEIYEKDARNSFQAKARAKSSTAKAFIGVGGRRLEVFLVVKSKSAKQKIISKKLQELFSNKYDSLKNEIIKLKLKFPLQNLIFSILKKSQIETSLSQEINIKIVEKILDAV